ncbi:tRNA preQ1(34) S-adenosylmethionine ribosyltransferase-isomerase QueA [Polynucleobacter sphagniphilus]|jgi:S-adenosylmethionine:tRNA ribosyltransferase-isomerase|uniref:tRNA preQ1(34) S-adenosylmethionine ribosyltransferase-isomerase QueA n=1 Tax=Polynucleobacter sphagniphilus TaxID=1743169 RepID=UPI00096B8933|nr:tRNA preQ1(34) S-adenosylmethionine ribosyltransferase-isomerase QueA [Polynucleobacter sphagniphilus]MDF9788689.1 S-adenosylmethionine:tRNA ribosyltransferase-isomerase [Polynucleobacter sphagniphilus]MDH6241857.1 S-adenosylmethionine:tRNA ribosyltransferase-isomerase [Polynucleobacter sphagniphilus]MDH6249193.1 S-adenosylmethionine:tRNA ribosyltransferase-isomerase [Polynucleobacter sphagniphilus]MDH6300166.1 S-adenosylmethionine:tRNA ribosyltransferase-isomerase [Polynucleobacter sphagnip
MQLSDFNYTLPPHLIAQHPLEKRTDSRLLEVKAHGDSSAQFIDRTFREIVDLIRPGDLLVMNDTKVIPARLHGKKETGGIVELLIERISGDKQAWVQVRASKVPKTGSIVHIHNQAGETFPVEMIGYDGRFYEVRFPENVLGLLERFGELPLPPYIEHQPTQEDAQRYQTVVAKNPGAVAAPTAGLHFDQAILQQLSDAGVNQAGVTLHVGAGTFTPVREEDLSKHQMHYEWYSVPQATIDAIAQTKHQGGRVIAVGTTSLRALESHATTGQASGETNLFITPGYEFKAVDCLLTNFHLPKSTLLMLVSAFAGMDNIRNAYQHAIDQSYRFFSYGDAMLLTRVPNTNL